MKRTSREWGADQEQTMGYKTKILIGLGALVVVGIGVGVYKLDEFLNAIKIELPEYQATKNTVWLDQNIGKDKLRWFYHADQGTRTFGIPFEWFTALEQPVISLIAVGLFSDPTYLDRYGFIPDIRPPWCSRR
jgi:hypothetical protein